MLRESLGGSTVGVSVMRTTYARSPWLNSRAPYDLDHWHGTMTGRSLRRLQELAGGWNRGLGGRFAGDEGRESGGLPVRVPSKFSTMTGRSLRRLQELAGAGAIIEAVPRTEGPDQP